MDVSSILKIYFTYQSSNDPIESLCEREANLVRGKMRIRHISPVAKASGLQVVHGDAL